MGLFFLSVANWNIGLLLDDVFDGLFRNWRILVDLLPLHFFVLSDLVAEVGGFFKVIARRLSLEFSASVGWSMTLDRQN